MSAVLSPFAYQRKPDVIGILLLPIHRDGPNYPRTGDCRSERTGAYFYTARWTEKKEAVPNQAHLYTAHSWGIGGPQRTVFVRRPVLRGPAPMVPALNSASALEVELNRHLYLRDPCH